ncbi:MAG: TonB-dependent receptor, partial [Chitinophagaceae bacterium]
MKWISCLAILFLQTLAAQECSFSLSGSVADADKRTPLANALVEIKELQLKTVTNAEGHYHFYQLCKGNYTLYISHVGCTPITYKLKLEKSQVRNFVLPHDVNELSEVLVYTKKDDKANIVKEEISKQAVFATRGLSLGEVLTKATGVTVLQTGSTIFKPVIHGLHSQRILLLNNGVRLEGQQWGSEHAPEIDPFTADKFTILKGAGALKYGSDAIGGAVLIEPKPLPMIPGTKGELTTAYFTNNRQMVVSAMIEHNSLKIPAFSARFQTTWKKGGNTRTPNYWLNNTGLQEWNLSTTLGWRKPKFRTELFFSRFQTSLGIFTGAHIGNLTDLMTAINSNKPLQNIDAFSYAIGRPKQEVTHYLVKSQSVFIVDQQRLINVTIAHQENIRQEYDRALITNRPELDLNIGTTNFDVNLEQKKQNGLQQTIGLQGTRQENVWNGSRFFIPNFISYTGSAYGIRKQNIGNLFAELGLRYDVKTLTVYRNQNNIISSSDRIFHNISASGALNFRLSNYWKLLLNNAYVWRAPQVNELFVNGLHHGTASFEIGNEALKSEKAWNFSAQLKFEKDSSWQADIQVYNNYISDFINLIPVLPPTLTLRGAYPTFQYIQTNARLTGIDFQVQKQLNNHWRTHAKAAFLWAYDTKQQQWLQQMPANRTEIELTRLWKNKTTEPTQITLGWQWIMRQSNIPNNFIDYLPP